MINGHIASAIVATPQHFLPSKGAAFALNGVLVTCVQRGGGGGEGGRGGGEGGWPSMLRLAKDGRGSLARDMTLRRPVEGDGDGRKMGKRGRR